MYYFTILFVYLVNYFLQDFYFEISISLCGIADVRVCSETKENRNDDAAQLRNAIFSQFSSGKHLTK